MTEFQQNLGKKITVDKYTDCVYNVRMLAKKWLKYVKNKTKCRKQTTEKM